MRAELDATAWKLLEIGDVEWFMLMQLPSAADPTRSEKGGARLFPNVVDEGLHPDILKDWLEFVRPELESQCLDDLETVIEDLSAAEETHNSNSEVTHELHVAIEHSFRWYRVLNQARLILHEEHNLASADFDFLAGEGPPSEIDERRWLLTLQFRIYGAIQEFLLSAILEPGLDG